MGVDVENSGMVQLVSLRASWLVYIYFLLGLWPSCSRSHLAPWACHVTWTCVCSSVAQVLSSLFLCVLEMRVMTIKVGFNVSSYFELQSKIHQQLDQRGILVFFNLGTVLACLNDSYLLNVLELVLYIASACSWLKWLQSIPWGLSNLCPLEMFVFATDRGKCWEMWGWLYF